MLQKMTGRYVTNGSLSFLGLSKANRKMCLSQTTRCASQLLCICWLMRLFSIRPVAGHHTSQMSSCCSSLPSKENLKWTTTAIKQMFQLLKWRIYVCWQGDNPESEGSCVKVGNRFWSRRKISCTCQLAIHLVSIPITFAFFSVFYSPHCPPWQFLIDLRIFSSCVTLITFPTLLLFFTFTLSFFKHFHVIILPPSLLLCLISLFAPSLSFPIHCNYCRLTKSFFFLALQKRKFSFAFGYSIGV
jgi:hypothetical protein